MQWCLWDILCAAFCSGGQSLHLFKVTENMFLWGYTELSVALDWAISSHHCHSEFYRHQWSSTYTSLNGPKWLKQKYMIMQWWAWRRGRGQMSWALPLHSAPDHAGSYLVCLVSQHYSLGLQRILRTFPQLAPTSYKALWYWVRREATWCKQGPEWYHGPLPWGHIVGASPLLWSSNLFVICTSFSNTCTK